ncbi:MAG: hypothetical protein HOP15_02550 [Planctomycetes bacterium]|nr:hypothetical protein [Planctomycetota bacterium]
MARRTRAPFSALAALVVLALHAPLARSQAPCQSALEYGMNPSFQTWSSRAIVFADAFQRVRAMSYWNNGPLSAAPLLAPGSGVIGAGWPDPAQLAPGQRYGAMLFGSMEGTLPDGREKPYVVTWSGAGHVRLEGPYVAGEQQRGASRVEVLVDPTIGNGNALLSVSWTATDPGDPVRDVHVWLPGMERSGRIFWPPFVAKVRALNAGRGPHTWRTLDWTRVNEYGRPLARGGFVFDLAGVIGTRSPSQGTLRGVAPEYQVALCNALGANLHFQLPHRASDMSVGDYVHFLGDQLRRVRDGSPAIPGLFGGRAFAGLDPALTLTVELSNEIWNSLFPVNAWMNSEAVRKGIPFVLQVAGEIQLLFDTAESVFAGPHAPRLCKYVGGFVGDPGYTQRLLANLRPGTHVHALGPALYLGPRKPDMDAWLAGSSAGACPNCPSPSQLLDAAGATLDRLRPLLAQHATLAQGWLNPDGSNPALELYEAGLNLKSAGRPWAAAARALQSDARLFELFSARFVPMLVEEGVELVNWYSFMSDQDAPTVDAFGFWNDMDQSLTLPIHLPYSDEGAPKAALVCLGPPLANACPRATAQARHAPANYACFTATPPVLGTTLHARVDLTSSGDVVAILIASLVPTSVLLPSGQTLLLELDGATFLPPRSGPLATWELGVPNDPSLVGIQLTTQAFLLGGRPGINLTNAMDLTFGR